MNKLVRVSMVGYRWSHRGPVLNLHKISPTICQFPQCTNGPNTLQWTYSLRKYSKKAAKVEEVKTVLGDIPVPELNVQSQHACTADINERTNDIATNNSDSAKVSIFIAKNKKLIEIGFDHQVKDLILFSPKTNNVIDIIFRETPSGPYENLPKSDREGMPKVESIDEILWKEQKINWKELPNHYLMLSKFRLTLLVVITSMAGYGMAPGSFHLLDFLLCTVGTCLTSSAANSVNQFFEVPYDSQMNRTKNRVLVRGLLSPLHAVGFAGVTSTLGLGILYFGVNPITAVLGAFNLGLYTLVYTPMKRVHIVNTWIGAIVGAVPPMMGWTACTGTLDPGAWLLGAILYAWQFPHFNALSWNLRPDYSRAGYRMMSVVNPKLCKRVALRYSVGMIGLCTMAPVLDVTTWTFAADSLPLNLFMSYLAWDFYRKGDSNSSRKLFRFTLIHIPALMLLMFISKKRFTTDSDSKTKPIAAETLV